MPSDSPGVGDDHDIDEELMDEAIENGEAISAIASSLVDYAVSEAGRDAGRTTEEQWERMGDHYRYQAVEQDPEQAQLDDYEEAVA